VECLGDDTLLEMMAMAPGSMTIISGHPKLGSVLFGFDGDASRALSHAAKLNWRQWGVSTTAQAARQTDHGGE
jgi:hypothetical protein